MISGADRRAWEVVHRDYRELRQAALNVLPQRREMGVPMAA